MLSCLHCGIIVCVSEIYCPNCGHSVCDVEPVAVHPFEEEAAEYKAGEPEVKG